MKTLVELYKRSQKFVENYTRSTMTSFAYILLILFFVSPIFGGPYEPGQPGGPWSHEEIDIVKDKVRIKNSKHSILFGIK